MTTTNTPDRATARPEDMQEIDMLLKLVALGDARAYSDIKHRWGNVAADNKRLRAILETILEGCADDPTKAGGLVITEVSYREFRRARALLTPQEPNNG